MYMVDLEESGFDEPRILHVPLSITFAELKEILEKVNENILSPSFESKI